MKKKSEASASPIAALRNARPASEIRELLRMKALITGPSGSGKTMLGARFAVGPRVLIAPTELQAIPSIQEANPEAVIWHNSAGEPGVRTAADLQELRALLVDPELPRHFDAFVLDSLTDCQRIIRDAYTKTQKSGRKTTDMETWGLIVDLTARLAREVRDLPLDVCVITLDAEVDTGDGIVHRPNLSGSKLPSQLAQYFNLVGFAHRRETSSGEIRHCVLFRSDDRYLTKGMSALRDLEPPEPLWWRFRRFGGDLPADVAARVGSWEALEAGNESEEDLEEPLEERTSSGKSEESSEDPFGGR
jgi:hypothetical protein